MPSTRHRPARNIRGRVLDAAEAAVNNSRATVYGGPEDNFTRIARLMNAHLRNIGILPPEAECLDENNPVRIITTTDVAILLTMVKIGRLANTPAHMDSWVDVAGYAACGAECSEKAKD